MHKLMYRFVATTKKKIPDPNLDTVALRASRVINVHICDYDEEKKDTRPKPRHVMPCGHSV